MTIENLMNSLIKALSPSLTITKVKAITGTPAALGNDKCRYVELYNGGNSLVVKSNGGVDFTCPDETFIVINATDTSKILVSGSGNLQYLLHT